MTNSFYEYKAIKELLYNIKQLDKFIKKLALDIASEAKIGQRNAA